jgi:uncharacterized membrane protein YkvA (DUF1232 family)
VSRPAQTASRTRSARPRSRPAAAASVAPEIEIDAAPRSGAKRTVSSVIRQIPNYLRLLGGLLTDRRVAPLDKLLVGAAIAYILMPLDLMPDFIPFLGEVDDVFLLVTALQRLITNAGRKVVMQYWQGAISDLDPASLRRVLTAAAFFLPRRMRRRLRTIGR